MKKVIVGLIAVGAILALRAAGHSGQKIREHCKQMAGRCRRMMAGQAEEPGERRGHCKEMAAQFNGHDQETQTNEQAEEAPQFAEVRGEAVGAA